MEKAYDKKEARRIRRKQGRQKRRIKKYGNNAHFSISTIEDIIERLYNQQRYDNPDAKMYAITTGVQGVRVIINSMGQLYNEMLWQRTEAVPK